jgi:hypothetical protein
MIFGSFNNNQHITPSGPLATQGNARTNNRTRDNNEQIVEQIRSSIAIDSSVHRIGNTEAQPSLRESNIQRNTLIDTRIGYTQNTDEREVRHPEEPLAGLIYSLLNIGSLQRTLNHSLMVMHEINHEIYGMGLSDDESSRGDTASMSDRSELSDIEVRELDSVDSY